MGCDIHFYKEKFVNGKWVTADAWEDRYGDGQLYVVDDDKTYDNRNYNLFGLLSEGVRTDHEYAFKKRGIPFDACFEVVKSYKEWDSDGHSHNYLYLHELKAMRAFLENQKATIEGMKDKDELEKLQASISSGTPDWELLYPYCGWGTGTNLREFKIDVPAVFCVGKALDKVIATFDGVDGENHRAVFWFDN